MSHRHINPDGSQGALLGNDVTLDFNITTPTDLKITKKRISGSDFSISHLISQINNLPDFLSMLLYNTKFVQTDDHIRNSLVSRTNCVEVLTLASSDNEKRVRCAAAYNRNTPLENLIVLSTDHYAIVRRSLTFNKSIPTDMLVDLSNDAIVAVRKVALHKLKKRQKV